MFWAKTAKKVFFIATAGRQVGLGKKFLVLAILGNGITVLRGSIMYYACTMLNYVMAILWFNAHGLTIKQYTRELARETENALTVFLVIWTSTRTV